MAETCREKIEIQNKEKRKTLPTGNEELARGQGKNEALQNVTLMQMYPKNRNDIYRRSNLT
jgi:hypothetical protein